MDSSSTSTNNAATQRAIALADCAPGLEDAQDALLRSLRHEVSELRSRLDQMGVENADLREICAANGICCEEQLAAYRHRRYFARLCDEHPIGGTLAASDVLRQVAHEFLFGTKNGESNRQILANLLTQE